MGFLVFIYFLEFLEFSLKILAVWEFLGFVFFGELVFWKLGSLSGEKA